MKAEDHKKDSQLQKPMPEVAFLEACPQALNLCQNVRLVNSSSLQTLRISCIFMFWAIPCLLDAPQKFGAYLVYLVFSLNALCIFWNKIKPENDENSWLNLTFSTITTWKELIVDLKSTVQMWNNILDFWEFLIFGGIWWFNSCLFLPGKT